MSRFWDAKTEMWHVQVLPGELYVTAKREVITTVLGSCVSACVRNLRRKIGGLNHFLLPHAPANSPEHEDLARYGDHALEQLLSRVRRGTTSVADLEVKVFGGGNVICSSSDIGAQNIAFVRAFFAARGIAIVADDVGGPLARRIRYWPQEGRVQVLQMPMSETKRIAEVEKHYEQVVRQTCRIPVL